MFWHKKRVLGKKKNSSWEKFLCRSGACGKGWGGMHFSAKDTLGGSSFGLFKHRLSASPGAAEHRRGGRTSLLTFPHDLVGLGLDFLVPGQVPSGPLQVLLLHRGPLLLDGGFLSASLGHGGCCGELLPGRQRLWKRFKQRPALWGLYSLLACPGKSLPLL